MAVREEKFIVHFFYLDGETTEVEIYPEDIKDFMDAIGKSEVYYNEEKGKGIWISIEKVRYFHLEKVKIEDEEPMVQETLSINDIKNPSQAIYDNKTPLLAIGDINDGLYSLDTSPTT